jgi:RNA polymerase sigma-70 factor (ECF subfamily)
MSQAAPGGTLGSANEMTVVALAVAGDDAAYGELVRRHQAAIRNLLRHLIRDAVLADDVAQQAFVGAWQSIRTLKSPSAFGAWLRKLAVNCWLQHIRAHKRELAVAYDAIPDVPVTSTVTEQLDLDAALAILPPDVRLCIVLAYSAGMSHAEISDSTAIPLGTVKSHITRGAARLRDLLHAYGARNA